MAKNPPNFGSVHFEIIQNSYTSVIIATCDLFTMANTVKDLNRMCCCCWEKFGVNNKALQGVTETVEELMRLYVFPGYSSTVQDYPSKICSNCYRNLYLLKEGKMSRSAWGQKISEVHLYEKCMKVSLKISIYLN